MMTETGGSPPRQSAADYWSKAFETRTSWIPTEVLPMQPTAPLCAALDDEIEALQHQILLAKSRRNAISPIFVLPTELLAHIFMLLSRVDPISATRRDWGWARVTQVCRRFRSLTFTHSSLWATLSPNVDCPWATLLSRARDAPLHIKGWWQPWPGDSFFKRYARDITQNRHRIHTLDLDASDKKMLKKILSAFKGSAPELRTLRLQGYAMHGLSTSTVDKMRIFLTSAPKLEEITLLGVPYPWPMFAHSLKTLELGCSKFQHITEISTLQKMTATWPSVSNLSDILEGLRQMPLLESLVMDYVCPVIPANAPAQDVQVALPRLRRLRLKHSDDRGLRLLSRLDITPTCSIDMTSVDLLWTSSFDALTDALVSFSTGNMPVFNTLSIGDELEERFGTMLLKLAVYVADQPDVPSRALDGPGISVTAKMTLGVTLDETLKKFLALLPQANMIHSIKFATRRDLSSEAALNLFGALPDIHTIHFFDPRYATAQMLLRLLNPEYHKQSDTISSSPAADASLSATSQSSMLLPYLSTLSFSDADLGPEEQRDPGYDDPDPLWAELVATLNARAQMGILLKKLVLKECEFRYDWFAEWIRTEQRKDKRTQVDWDHSCGRYDELGSDTDEEEEGDEEEQDDAEGEGVTESSDSEADSEPESDDDDGMDGLVDLDEPDGPFAHWLLMND